MTAMNCAGARMPCLASASGRPSARATLWAVTAVPILICHLLPVKCEPCRLAGPMRDLHGAHRNPQRSSSTLRRGKPWPATISCQAFGDMGVVSMAKNSSFFSIGFKASRLGDFDEIAQAPFPTTLARIPCPSSAACSAPRAGCAETSSQVWMMSVSGMPSRKTDRAGDMATARTDSK